MNFDDDFQDIREGVRALSANFPGSYWQEMDRERAYPEAFVAALTEAGYLAALILKKSTPLAVMAPPVMPRCTPWVRC